MQLPRNRKYQLQIGSLEVISGHAWVGVSWVAFMSSFLFWDQYNMELKCSTMVSPTKITATIYSHFCTNWKDKNLFYLWIDFLLDNLIKCPVTKTRPHIFRRSEMGSTWTIFSLIIILICYTCRLFW